MSSARCRQIVLGIGNVERGDDAAGRTVVRLLQGRLPDDVEIAELEGEAMELLARFEGVDAAFLVDACWSGAPAGTIRRLDVNVTPLQQGIFSLSTHGFGLAEAMELARVLTQLPPYCVVYAIEGIHMRQVRRSRKPWRRRSPMSPRACEPKLLTKTMLKDRCHYRSLADGKPCSGPCCMEALRGVS